MADVVLVRYGAISEVARFESELSEAPLRGETVVVRTARGLELGEVLQRVGRADGAPSDFQIVRRPTAEDDAASAAHAEERSALIAEWTRCLADWNLKLELLDVEWTLDRSRCVLYVLAPRGPDTTLLAIRAAAAGLTGIEVQPVGPEGLLTLPREASGGGCGSGGCGCEH